MTIELTAEAQRALISDGPILVRGGPGSGKTTLALLKAQKMIPSLLPGQGILFLSFSRAAVRHVLSKLKSTVPQHGRQLIIVKTYHAFFMDVLRAHGQLLTGTTPRVMAPGPERLAKSDFEGDWIVESVRKASEEGIYTFDQFAPSCADLIARSECVRTLLTSRYPILILDEFQDTADAQWEAVKLLSQTSEVIALADPDQRIFDYDVRVDPERLAQFESALSPAIFDLGGENHRSPNTEILEFANAVLRNRALPETDEVKLIPLHPKVQMAGIRAVVTWVFGDLRERDILNPSVAILCRTNSMVATISGALNEEQVFGGTVYRAIEHHVLSDAELIASAARVVASILEWPTKTKETAVSATLAAISEFYENKNAERPSASARNDGDSYRKAAAKVLNGFIPGIKAGKALVAEYEVGIALRGDAMIDWVSARDIIARIPKLREVFTNARYLRLYRARDEIGGRLSQQWADTGTYRNATEIVSRVLASSQVISTQSDPGGLQVMNIHKSKGKEFDAVILVEGAYVGQFFDPSREAEPFDATRRLLRVAITRARYQVVIIRPPRVRPLTDA